MEFIKGLYAKRNEKAPEFVICNLSIKTEAFIQYLQENTNEAGYCNIDIKRARDGKIYSQLNDFTPSNTNTANGQKQVKETKKNEFGDDILETIPF